MCNKYVDLIKPRAEQAIIDGVFNMDQDFENVAEKMFAALAANSFNAPALAGLVECLTQHESLDNSPILYFKGGLNAPTFWINADDCHGQTKTVMEAEIQY